MFKTTMEIIFWISSLLIIYGYTIYPLILIALTNVKRSIEPIFSTQFPTVSIVIAAYNEEDVIKSRLENLLELDYPQDKLEIIIASDGSTDNTANIVRNFNDEHVVLKDYAERRGKVNVLNETVPQAKNDIIVFSDANTMFEKDALKKLVRHFQIDNVGCVCGSLKFVNAKGSTTGDLEGVYWRFETFLKKKEGAHGSLLGANGAIYAIRKDYFEQCPEDTIVEDFVIPMLILEKGHQVVYEPEAIAIEETAKHIIQEKERRIRIGAGDFQALFMLISMLNFKRGFSAVAFWSHKVLRWFAPFFLILAFVSNLALIGHTFYFALFIIQCAFYLSAFVGQLLSWSGLNIKFFSLCYYFISMNLALLLGFVRFVSDSQAVTWERTERST